MSLGWYAAVFQTEVMAPLGCAQRLEDLKVEGKDISICSSSQVALGALAVPETHSRLVGECKEALERVGAQQTPFPLGTGTYRDQRQRDS